MGKMKRNLAIFFALLASPALAQSVPQNPERPVDDLTAAYYACVSHQERDARGGFHYSGVWADSCPKIEAAWIARDRSQKAARDSADMEKVTKAVKQLPR